MNVRAILILALVTLSIAPPPSGAADCPSIPSPDDLGCEGLHPGARIVTESSAGRCTLNFVWTNATRTFIGTAGHCVALGQRVRQPGHEPFGTVVARSPIAGPATDDFALILVDEDAAAGVDPRVAQWGGPAGVFAGPVFKGLPVVHTGHGYLNGDDPYPPRPRPGVGSDWNGRSFSFYGYAYGGDSGSPVLTATGEAVGIIVRGPTGQKTYEGPTIQRAQAIVAEQVPSLGQLTLATAPFGPGAS